MYACHINTFVYSYNIIDKSGTSKYFETLTLNASFLFNTYYYSIILVHNNI